MNRVGFEGLPPCSKKFDKLRLRFCKRLAFAHRKIAKRFLGTSFSWDTGNNYRCKCGKFVVKNWCVRAFVHREYTWPESFLHHVRYHGVAPPKGFYIMIVNATAKYIPLNKLETKTVNKLLSGT